MFIFLDIDGVLNKESDWSKQFTLSSDCIRRFCEKYRTDMMRYSGKGLSDEDRTNEYY